MDWTSLTGSKTTTGSIARWLNKGTLTSGAGGDADDILQEAMASIFGKLRHWQMLTAPIAGTMVIGADQIAVPSDMLEPDLLQLTGTYQSVLLQKTPNEVYAAWSYDGTGTRIQQTPCIYSFNQTYLQLDSQPDQAYAYVQTYYQVPAVLSSDNTTNFLTIRYPRLVRAAVMMAGSEWTKENNQGQYDRTYWGQQLAAELALAQEQSDRARRGITGGAVFGESAAMFPAYSGPVF